MLNALVPFNTRYVDGGSHSSALIAAPALNCCLCTTGSKWPAPETGVAPGTERHRTRSTRPSEEVSHTLGLPRPRWSRAMPGPSRVWRRRVAVVGPDEDSESAR